MRYGCRLRQLPAVQPEQGREGASQDHARARPCAPMEIAGAESPCGRVFGPLRHPLVRELDLWFVAVCAD